MPSGITQSLAGNTSAGALTQLIAQGAVDKYLYESATKTFWKMRYDRCTQFSMEGVLQQFQSQVAFGQSAQLTVNRTGDLIYYMYVAIELPGICLGHDCATRSTFPVADGSAHYRADASVYAEYCSESDIAANVGSAAPGSAQAVHEAIENGRSRWLRDNYGSAPVEGSAFDGQDEAPEKWVSWCNAIGQVLIKQASISIGGSVVSELYSTFLIIWDELSGKSGKELREMIGRRDTRAELVRDSARRRLLYVPLPFWFTESAGQALPLASLQFHGVQVQVHFEELARCIQTSEDNAQVLNCDTNAPVQASDLRAAIETTMVYLGTQERAKFSSTHFEVLITQVQQMTQTCSTSVCRMQLAFNHPCLELLFVCKRRSAIKSNSHTDFGGIDNRDPIDKLTLYLNNQTRFSCSAPYLRLVQPYQHHSRIPDGFIYSYSFALNPEVGCQPSGSLNFSRIDNVDITVELQPGLSKEGVDFHMYARTVNVARFREGLMGVAFAN